MVTGALEVTVSGVPEISPVRKSSDRPDGSEPVSIVQSLETPPTLVGNTPVTGVFLMKVNGEPG